MCLRASRFGYWWAGWVVGRLAFRIMSVEYLSDDQVARYGRFAQEPSPQELEAFFRLDEAALERAGTKRRPHNRLGWSVQWGTVRMLGTFLSQPAKVPPGVAAFVADQLGIADALCLQGYPERLPTQHEHAREIRALLKVKDFEDCELELRQHVAGRVWVSNEGPRALFDRGVTWLRRNRCLLPGASGPPTTTVRPSRWAGRRDGARRRNASSRKASGPRNSRQSIPSAARKMNRRRRS